MQNDVFFISHVISVLFALLTATTLHITKYYETSLRDVLPHISMVVSAMTSSLRAEPRKCLPNERRNEEGEEVESILLNISGRLIMLQRDFTMVTEAGRKKVSFGPPVCLSSQVEVVWAPPPDTSHQRLSCLTQSLWLHSGSQGVKVRIHDSHKLIFHLYLHISNSAYTIMTSACMELQWIDFE